MKGDLKYQETGIIGVNIFSILNLNSGSIYFIIMVRPSVNFIKLAKTNIDK
jgi:hypothetical protein